MSHPSNPVADDLVRLWRESLLPSPDPERLANQVARLALRRFDRVVSWRNVREYAAALAVVGFAVWRFMAGDDFLQAGAIVGGTAFVAAYLWFQHRRLPRLDPAASGRDYQAALLARIDRQIALLGSVRYWYLLPLYVPVLVQVVHAWQTHQRAAAVLMLVVVTALYAALAHVNERLAVNHLKEERARVASLYGDPTD
jgi:uncharacterized membrane protein YbaN (DUF454 family)